MEKAGNGFDLQAIEDLFRKDYKSLCNSSYRILKDWDAAQDVVQETFIKFWKKRNDLTIAISPKAYLFKSVINASLNYLESNKRTLPLREEITEASTSGLAVNEPDKIEEKELQVRIEQALERLPPKCKAIFILCKYEGMKYQQIADQLNISLKTVENQMGIALQKLREDLKAYASREFLLWPVLLILMNLPIV